MLVQLLESCSLYISALNSYQKSGENAPGASWEISFKFIIKCLLKAMEMLLELLGPLLLHVFIKSSLRQMGNASNAYWANSFKLPHWIPITNQWAMLLELLGPSPFHLFHLFIKCELKVNGKCSCLGPFPYISLWNPHWKLWDMLQMFPGLIPSVFLIESSFKLKVQWIMFLQFLWSIPLDFLCWVFIRSRCNSFKFHD